MSQSNLLATIQKYDEIYNYLTNIIDTYEELITLEQKEERPKLLKNKLLYQAKRDKIDKKLNKIFTRPCNHHFVDDYIDIDPDRSQKITYCDICEYTKP